MKTVIKRNEVLIRGTTWMNLENMSERSQSQKTVYCMMALYGMSRLGKSISGCLGLGVGRKWGVAADGLRLFFRGRTGSDENILKLIVVLMAQLYDCTK